MFSNTGNPFSIRNERNTLPFLMNFKCSGYVHKRVRNMNFFLLMASNIIFILFIFDYEKLSENSYAQNAYLHFQQSHYYFYLIFVSNKFECRIHFVCNEYRCVTGYSSQLMFSAPFGNERSRGKILVYM